MKNKSVLLLLLLAIFCTCNNVEQEGAESVNSKLLQEVAQVLDDSYGQYEGKLLDRAFEKNIMEDLAAIEFLMNDIGVIPSDLGALNTVLNWGEYSLNRLEIMDSLEVNSYKKKESVIIENDKNSNGLFSAPVIETSFPYFNENKSEFFIEIVFQNGKYGHTNYLYYKKKDGIWKLEYSKSFGS